MASLPCIVQKRLDAHSLWITIRNEIAEEMDVFDGDTLFQDVMQNNGEKIIILYKKKPEPQEARL